MGRYASDRLAPPPKGARGWRRLPLGETSNPEAGGRPRCGGAGVGHAGAAPAWHPGAGRYFRGFNVPMRVVLDWAAPGDFRCTPKSALSFQSLPPDCSSLRQSRSRFSGRSAERRPRDCVRALVRSLTSRPSATVFSRCATGSRLSRMGCLPSWVLPVPASLAKSLRRVRTMNGRSLKEEESSRRSTLRPLPTSNA